MISKKIYIPILAAGVIGGTAVFGVSLVNAQATQHNPMSGLVQKIAQKFNLDQSQVQSVIDQFHTEQQQVRQQEMQKREEERLSQLVLRGKITELQKQAIIAKHVEMRTKFNPDTMKTMTQEQRKEHRTAMETEMKTWASTQGIDLTIIQFGFGKGGGFGRGGMHEAPPTQ